MSDAFEKVLKVCEEKREIAANGLVTPTPLNPGQSPWDEKNVWNDHEEDIKEVQLKIAKDIGHYLAKPQDGLFVNAGAISSSSSWIYLFLDPKRLQISDLVADAWGINLKKFITLSLQFAGNYTDSTHSPSVSCYQSGVSGVSKLDGTELNDKSKFGLYWTVENRIKEDFFGKFWPLKTNYNPVFFKNLIH